jgi:hypothetical protein
MKFIPLIVGILGWLIAIISTCRGIGWMDRAWRALGEAHILSEQYRRLRVLHGANLRGIAKLQCQRDKLRTELALIKPKLQARGRDGKYVRKGKA